MSMYTVEELEAHVEFWKQRAMNALHDRNNYKSLLEIAEDTLKVLASFDSILATAGLKEMKAFRDAIESSINQEVETNA